MSVPLLILFISRRCWIQSCGYFAVRSALDSAAAQGQVALGAPKLAVQPDEHFVATYCIQCAKADAFRRFPHRHRHFARTDRSLTGDCHDHPHRRFTDAVDYARIAHAPQVRKGSGIPYIYHLLGVASLVLEYRGHEDQAIAGLLHDVLEDCGDGHRAMIRAQLGCRRQHRRVLHRRHGGKQGHAERTGSARDHWRERKLAYLDHLRKVPESTPLLVSGCDKLHNARAILWI